jgi:choline dehydrogenase
MLGVGENLQDHLVIGVINYSTKPVSLANATKPGALLNYLLFKRGMLTSNGAEGGAFAKSKPNLELPDLQFHFFPGAFEDHGATKVPDVGYGQHGFSVGAVVLRPESRGTIRLHSNDPFDAPSIQPRYMSTEADMERTIGGLKLTRKLVQAHAFDEFRGLEHLPGPKIQTDEEFAQFVRERGETLYHPVGTSKMGIDDMAVVNPQLQVYGIDNLRVVDASIMPTITSGNTNAPTIMIAEKASDMIKQAQ